MGFARLFETEANLAGPASTRVAGLTRYVLTSNIGPLQVIQRCPMNPPQSQNPPPMPLAEELEVRLQALRKLRRQMLALHARLEYLRLMLRVSGPELRPTPPRTDAR